MPHVTNVRLLRGAGVAILFAASVACADTLVAATPANPAQPRLLTTPRATSSAPANPLRPASTVKISQPVQATKVAQPDNKASTVSGAAASTPPPAKNFAAPAKPFVPNTGRLQIFRAATKEDTAERTLERGPLFPQQSTATQSSATKHVMRYQDVSRGAVLVPIKPRPNDAAPASQKSPPRRRHKRKSSPPLLRHGPFPNRSQSRP